jgi:hypothetical protein
VTVIGGESICFHQNVDKGFSEVKTQSKLSGKHTVSVRNMVHVVLYGADKAVIVYIVHSELYRIIILNNNYNYHSIDITASALYS